MDKKLASKLFCIQQSLFVPKGQKNQFGGYNYRSCEDILKTLKPLLAEQKCAVFLDEDTRTVGNWVYAVAIATLVDCESGESFSVSAQAREPEMRKGMDAAQVTGSSMSYARKYALAGMFGIDNERDPDSTNDHGKGDANKGDGNRVTAAQLLAPKKPSKKAEAWAKYKAAGANDGVSADVLAVNFKSLCETVAGDPAKFTDAEWDKVIEAIPE